MALEAVRSQLEELPPEVGPSPAGVEEETIAQALLSSTVVTGSPFDEPEGGSDQVIPDTRPTFVDVPLFSEPSSEPLPTEKPAPVVRPVVEKIPSTRVTERPFVGSVAEEEPVVEEARGSRRGLLVFIVILLVAAAVAFFLMRKSSPVNEPVITQTATTQPIDTTAQPLPPVVKSSMAINSFPWSEVTSVRNVESGESLALNNVVTPARIDVAAGTYDVTLRRADGQSVTRRVDVSSAGGDLNVQFDGAGNMTPSFGGAP
jgi:hypothetical protein